MFQLSGFDLGCCSSRVSALGLRVPVKGSSKISCMASFDGIR